MRSGSAWATLERPCLKKTKKRVSECICTHDLIIALTPTKHESSYRKCVGLSGSRLCPLCFCSARANVNVCVGTLVL
jgi:hypothetical protein